MKAEWWVLSTGFGGLLPQTKCVVLLTFRPHLHCRFFGGVGNGGERCDETLISHMLAAMERQYIFFYYHSRIV
jgi:hypothetical protein